MSDDLASLLRRVQDGHEPTTAEVRSVAGIEPAVVERAVLAAQAEPYRDAAEIACDAQRGPVPDDDPRVLARNLPRY